MKRLLKPFAALWLKSNGWKAIVEESFPDKCVVIAAPHTSNWDMPYTLSVGILLDMNINWLGKHTIFKRPWKRVMTFLGGIPIHRGESKNYVESLAEEFSKRDRLILVIAPEGTRSRTDYWRSGFYHIAKAADVPIVAGYLDYKAKAGGFGKVIYPIGTLEEVLSELREFYEGKEGYHQDWFGPICSKAQKDA